jgi:hypothetical protein
MSQEICAKLQFTNHVRDYVCFQIISVSTESILPISNASFLLRRKLYILKFHRESVL